MDEMDEKYYRVVHNETRYIQQQGVTETKAIVQWKPSATNEKTPELLNYIPDMYDELKRHCALCKLMHLDNDECSSCKTGRILFNPILPGNCRN